MHVCTQPHTHTHTHTHTHKHTHTHTHTHTHVCTHTHTHTCININILMGYTVHKVNIYTRTSFSIFSTASVYRILCTWCFISYLSVIFCASCHVAGDDDCLNYGQANTYVAFSSFTSALIPLLCPWSTICVHRKLHTTECTVESLLKDTLNKGHHRKYLSTKNTFGGTKTSYPMVIRQFHLQRVDKLAGPNVSFRQKVHCICITNYVML